MQDNAQLTPAELPQRARGLPDLSETTGSNRGPAMVRTCITARRPYQTGQIPIGIGVRRRKGKPRREAGVLENGSGGAICAFPQPVRQRVN